MVDTKLEQVQTHLREWLLAAILISVVIVSIGGVYFLVLHGQESIYTQTFYTQMPQQTSLSELLSLTSNMTPEGIVLAGLFFLVVAQLLRVLLAGWYFFRIKDKAFILMTVSIFLILIYTLFFRF